MRIVHVILAYYPCQIWGGPPQIASILSKGLSDRGHTVQILTTNILDYKKRMSESSLQAHWNGIPVTYLHAYWFARRAHSIGFIFAPDLWNYQDVIAQADVIHIHGYRHFLFSATSLLAQLHKVPFVVQAHGTMNTQFGRRRLKRVYDSTLGRMIAKRAASAIALSDFEIAEYESLGIEKEVITKIFNPWDPGSIETVPDQYLFRDKYCVKPGEWIVLFLARLHERKGLDRLIQAVAALDRSNVRLFVVGPDDGFEDRARGLTAQLGLNDRTVFTGPLYGVEKYAAYSAADVFVLPSLGGEGLPTTVIEACYSATPMILSDTIEVARIIDGRAGVAVAPEVDQLRMALDDMLDNPTQMKRYSEQGPILLREHFDLSTILDQLEAVYDRALLRQSRSAG